MSPNKACLHPGCGNYSTFRGRCPLHNRQNDKSINRAGSKVYSSKRWLITRRHVIFEQPVCAAEGCSALSSEVDHVVAIQDGGAEWSRCNLQGLCATHHAQKGRAEQIARTT